MVPGRAWRSVNAEANLKILDNLTELEAERALEEFRVQNLVDPLPFLKAGEWAGVNVESFVPALDKPAEDSQVAPRGSSWPGRPVGSPL